jgi:ribonuclease-3
MSILEGLLHLTPEIETKIGYHFKDRSLLVLAFVHRSFINEHRDVSYHNERLEFLGDSILGLLTAEYLYKLLPDVPEGDLSYLRSRLVEASSCVKYLHQLQVENYVLLGKGEKRNDGRGRESILADLFEALMGAIYLDGGIEAARHFFFGNFAPEIDAILKTPLRNWKALLQDYCQKKFQHPPHYEVIEAVGPEHSKFFTIAVTINETELGRGTGASKKEAQQAAAADALAKVDPEMFHEGYQHGSS